MKIGLMVTKPVIFFEKQLCTIYPIIEADSEAIKSFVHKYATKIDFYLVCSCSEIKERKKYEM